MKNRQKAAMRTLFGVIFVVSGVVLIPTEITVIAHLEKFSILHLIPLAICGGFIFLGLKLFEANTKDLMERAAAQNDPKKAARIVRYMRKMTDEKYLKDLSLNAGRDDIAKAALDRYFALYGEKPMAEMAASKYFIIHRLINALEYVNDSSLLKYVAETAYQNELAVRAIQKLEDRGILRDIAFNEELDVRARAEALDKIGESSKGDLLRVTNLVFTEAIRRKAAQSLLASGDTALIEEAALGILTLAPDSAAKDFVADAAAKYPDIFKKIWQKLTVWSHINRTDHTDFTTTPPHTDSIQYYDYYKLPSGLTYANKGGRQKHTDQTLPSSDCAEYGHTDSSTHQDRDDEAFLERLPAAIKS
ncbi:MAG: hypothetical protein J5822_01755 [Eubacteriaceae bacterium]|nr:hypothetical protein [Eubacteriaceae bacterium]